MRCGQVKILTTDEGSYVENATGETLIDHWFYFGIDDN